LSREGDRYVDSELAIELLDVSVTSARA
jgi:hypothetical protein